jgi:signal transduction histidine kinase
MEQAILNTVFEVEREIREMVAAEQQRADGNLAELRRKCAEMAAEEEMRLKRELAAAVAAVGTGEALRRAEALLAEAEGRAKRLAGLADGQLKGVLQQWIRSILPGE